MCSVMFLFRRLVSIEVTGGFEGLLCIREFVRRFCGAVLAYKVVQDFMIFLRDQDAFFLAAWNSSWTLCSKKWCVLQVARRSLIRTFVRLSVDPVINDID